MTVVVDDPLIAGMAIAQPLPLHESSRRLRELYPECPRVYGVAVMADCRGGGGGRWPTALTTDRLQAMFEAARRASRTAAPRSRSSWPRRWPTSSSAGWSRCSSWRAAHGIPGWRTCGCTATPRAPSTGSASSTPRCGRCPTTPTSPVRTTGRPGRIVALPNEAALTTWVAHRSHRALEPLFDRLARSAAARCPVPRCGTSSGPRSSAPPPRSRCWPARAS